MAKWQVHAPNGRNLTINTGGAGDSKYVHGQITGNEKAAKLFPQYFIPVFDMNDMPATPPPVEVEAPKPTLEEKLLNEDKGPQMLTEVPKAVDVEVEEKDDAVDSGEFLKATPSKKKSSKKKVK